MFVRNVAVYTEVGQVSVLAAQRFPTCIRPWDTVCRGEEEMIGNPGALSPWWVEYSGARE